MRLFELFPSRPPNGKFEAARSLLFSSLSQVRESVDDSIAVSVYVIMRVFIKSYFFYQSFSIFVIYFLALSCRRDFSAIIRTTLPLSLSLSPLGICGSRTRTCLMRAFCSMSAKGQAIKTDARMKSWSLDPT